MFEPNIKIWTEEEKAEARRQQGMLGVNRSERFYCSKKVAAGFRNFLHGRRQFGSIGVDADGRDYVQVDSINLEVKTKLAALFSDKAWHQFLGNYYDTNYKIYEKRIESSKKAQQADQKNIKQCQNEHEDLNKNQSFRQSDRVLQQRQKTKKPPLPFDKDNYETWQSLDQENAERSKSNLIEKKTDCLVKIQKCDDANISLKTGRKPVDKKINELKAKLDTDLSEHDFKDVKLSLEYYELKIKKIEVKIEKNNEEKARFQAELERLEREIAILNCCMDRYNLLHEAKNWNDRKSRTVERVHKVLKDRDDLVATRENLNKLWHELTMPEDPEKKSSPLRQGKPETKEELCERLPLKADAQVYFI